MSRSRRKTPVTGWCSAPSDKQFKQLENRKARRKARTCSTDELELLSPKQFGNPWLAPKDGKMRFNPGKSPELMRK